MPLPRSVIFLKIRFLKGLKDMSLNFLHKDQEAIRTPVVRVQKTASTLCDQTYRCHTICRALNLLALPRVRA